MCSCFFIRICMVLLLSSTFVYSEATTDYDVLVAFSQNVPSQTCETISKIQVSLEDASKVLHKAIGLQFFKVIFKIPESWDITECNITVHDSYISDSRKADILIDNVNDTAFGQSAFTHQYGSCGIPGHQLIIPTGFFHDLNTFPKGISLAREWLKYRYGVFDENGYFKDSLYPLYYIIPGGSGNEVQVTDCTNSKITYNFTDQNNQECPSDETLIQKLYSRECTLNIDEENLDDVSSSFMYFQERITSMTDICGRNDGHQHNSRSPNKQNALCYGQSIWDVISKSNNFKKDAEEKDYTETEFVFLKETKPRVVIAFENAKRLEKYKGTKIIPGAITKLMIDLPDGSKFLAFPFYEDVPKKDLQLHELTEEIKIKIAPDLKADFVKENGNYKEAMKKAISILKDDDGHPNGNVIIITGNPENLIVVLLKDACIKDFDVDSLPENTDELNTNPECLEVVRIPMSYGFNETYQKLIEVIEIVCPNKLQDKLTETLKIKDLEGNGTSIDVEVDDYTEAITFSIITDKEAENFKLKTDGKTQEQTKRATYGNIVELSYPVNQAGDYYFSYPYPTETDPPMLVIVRKTSKEGKYFSGKVIVHDTTVESDSHQMPVIIYAIARFGSYPLQNIAIWAEIQGPDGNVTSFKLNDDGNGDPDITKNDGIYSRYFTAFSGKGDYTVNVFLDNYNNTARYGKTARTGYRSCCGSDVNIGEDEDIYPGLSPFIRIFSASFTAKSGRPDSGYKPSRVTDLRIGGIADDGIILKWTAPGEEADDGTVQSYIIKSFTSPEDAKNNFEEKGDLLDYASEYHPAERGETVELKISYNNFKTDGSHYIAMKAKNSKDQESDLSTIIEVYISNRDTTEDPDNKDKETGGGGTNTAKTSPKTIGLIVGLIVGLILLIILIYVIVYFVVVKPKRKKEQKDNPIYETSKRTENKEPSQRTENNVLNPISFVSADTLIKHHKEKVKAKTENKEPPIFNEEDFEDRNLRPTRESRENDRDQERNHENPRNGPPYPPKSPKRITPV